jgi:hypothetical protein
MMLMKPSKPVSSSMPLGRAAVDDDADRGRAHDLLGRVAEAEVDVDDTVVGGFQRQFHLAHREVALDAHDGHESVLDAGDVERLRAGRERRADLLLGHVLAEDRPRGRRRVHVDRVVDLRVLGHDLRGARRRVPVEAGAQVTGAVGDVGVHEEAHLRGAVHLPVREVDLRRRARVGRQRAPDQVRDSLSHGGELRGVDDLVQVETAAGALERDRQRDRRPRHDDRRVDVAVGQIAPDQAAGIDHVVVEPQAGDVLEILDGVVVLVGVAVVALDLAVGRDVVAGVAQRRDAAGGGEDGVDGGLGYGVGPDRVVARAGGQQQANREQNEPTFHDNPPPN